MPLAASDLTDRLLPRTLRMAYLYNRALLSTGSINEVDLLKPTPSVSSEWPSLRTKVLSRATAAKPRRDGVMPWQPPSSAYGTLRPKLEPPRYASCHNSGLQYGCSKRPGSRIYALSLAAFLLQILNFLERDRQDSNLQPAD